MLPHDIRRTASQATNRAIPKRSNGLITDPRRVTMEISINRHNSPKGIDTQQPHGGTMVAALMLQERHQMTHFTIRLRAAAFGLALLSIVTLSQAQGSRQRIHPPDPQAGGNISRSKRFALPAARPPLRPQRFPGAAQRFPISLR